MKKIPGHMLMFIGIFIVAFAVFITILAAGISSGFKTHNVAQSYYHQQVKSDINAHDITLYIEGVGPGINIDQLQAIYIINLPPGATDPILTPIESDSCRFKVEYQSADHLSKGFRNDKCLKFKGIRVILSGYGFQFTP